MSCSAAPSMNGSPRNRRAGLAPITGLLLLIGGCTMFDSDSSKQQAQASGTSPVSSADFPNLASVPDQPPAVTPKIERDKLIQGLAADRANAEYTGEMLGESTANVPAASPPPARVPPPAAPEGDQAASMAEEDGETEPAPVPPPEIVALPVETGTPAALIYFDQDSIGLSDRDRAILRDVVRLQQQAGARIRVIGHASSSEEAADTDAAGTDLALVRANAVAETLIGLGAPSRFVESGTMPGGQIYDESQPNGAAANRRVEVFLGS